MKIHATGEDSLIGLRTFVIPGSRRPRVEAALSKEQIKHKWGAARFGPPTVRDGLSRSVAQWRLTLESADDVGRAHAIISGA